MRPQLRALAATQGGLITRRQALAAGYSDGEIRRFTSVHGPWAIVRRGVYAERTVVEAADPFEGAMALQDRAAHLTMTRPHLMSHDSAARAHGLATLHPKQALVHITRFGVGGSRTEEGVKHHLTRLGLLDSTVIDGMRVTGLSRTALDLGREHGFVAGTVACDAALQRGVLPSDFDSDLGLMTYWPGVTRARAAAAAADPGAESVGETLTRILLESLGLGVPETQFPILVGSTVFWADLRIGCHLFEFDGRVKFLRPALGGIADRPVEDIVWEEKRRQDAICAEGLGMSRVVWEELFGPARRRTADRLCAEYAVTARRFGDELPEHLARFAAAQKRHRSRGHRRLA
jgi:hypothetical protein